VIFEAIPRFLHQFTPGRYYRVIFVAIDTASRKFQNFATDTMLILVIDQKAPIFGEWDDAYPTTIFNDVIVWDDWTVGNSYF
jgi:hypothetical protein